MKPKPIALLSVTSRDGIFELAGGLIARGYSIVATSGTAKVLRDAGIEVITVAQYTRSQEILDGRVKTLHPAIHAGILADREHAQHVYDVAIKGYSLIDIVVVDPYSPPRDVHRMDPLELCDQVDIGGIALLRAAAKNWKYVWVIHDPCQYEWLLQSLDLTQDPQRQLRERLAMAQLAFEVTSAYDEKIFVGLTRALKRWDSAT